MKYSKEQIISKIKSLEEQQKVAYSDFLFWSIQASIDQFKKMLEEIENKHSTQ